MDPDPGAGTQAARRRRPLALAAGVLAVGLVVLVAGFVFRRSPAAPSAAPSLSASSGSPSPACPPWGCAQQERFAAASAYLAKQPGFLAIVVRDRRTHEVWKAGPTDHLTWAASTVKLAMAAALLEGARVGQVTLDAPARQQLADMLNWSSDAAADALWNRYGGETLVPRFVDKYGMAKLAFVSGFARRWGHMKCTPDDLAALMSYILDKMLSEDRGYLVDGMRKVGPVQRWGVWGAGPDQQPGNKDGWSIEPDGGAKHWVTNTVGFAGPEERYVVAVMYHLPASVPTTAAGVHTGAHAVSDLVATVFGAPVPAVVSVPDHE